MNIIRKYTSFLYVLLFTAIMTGIAWYINGMSFVGIDDANIYLVYMRNLADGHGFVYNAGGERVEGFTSLLWTLIGAVFFLVSSYPEILLLFFNLFIVSYALWRISCFINSQFHHDRFLSAHVLLFLGLLVAIPGYFDWCVLSLLETGLWSVLLILLSINILEFPIRSDQKRYRFSFAVLLILLVLCRPESIAWGMAFLIIRTIQLWLIEGSLKQTFAGLIIPSLFFIVSLFSLTVWRLYYFGYPLPNTYYAKVSADKVANLKAGILYIYKYFIENPFVVLLCCLCLKYMIDIFRPVLKKQVSVRSVIRERFALLFCITIMMLTFLISLYSGGDHFRYYRFIQPTTPIILLSPLFVALHFGLRVNKSWTIITLIFVFFSSNLSLFHVAAKRIGPIRNEWSLAKSGRQSSEILNKFFEILPRYPSQGVLVAGGTAYSYKGITIDLLGLNNVQMAHADKVKDRDVPKNHASFNKNIFYKQKPDLFWLSGVFRPVGKYEPLKIGRFSALCFKNIYRDERFRNEYSYCVIIRKDFPETLAIFASNTFLQSLDTAHFRVIRY